jgi:hypothetical protein
MEFFTTVTSPGSGAITLVLVNVQVVVTPGTTVMEAGVPFVHVALV